MLDVALHSSKEVNKQCDYDHYRYDLIAIVTSREGVNCYVSMVLHNYNKDYWLYGELSSSLRLALLFEL